MCTWRLSVSLVHSRRKAFSPAVPNVHAPAIYVDDEVVHTRMAVTQVRPGGHWSVWMLTPAISRRSMLEGRGITELRSEMGMWMRLTIKE